MFAIEKFHFTSGRFSSENRRPRQNGCSECKVSGMKETRTRKGSTPGSVEDNDTGWRTNDYTLTSDDYRRMEARRRLELYRDEAMLRAQTEDIF
jgi:hypothetical protein